MAASASSIVSERVSDLAAPQDADILREGMFFSRHVQAPAGTRAFRLRRRVVGVHGTVRQGCRQEGQDPDRQRHHKQREGRATDPEADLVPAGRILRNGAVREAAGTSMPGNSTSG